MIDLSYLTEEEQEMIMTVLKRDLELQKANKERIKRMPEVSREADKLKYMTGAWFYEAKSQKHQDRIHGSDIIMASMRQRKPMTVDFATQSWRDRPSSSNNIMEPKPDASVGPKESGSLEGAQQNRQDKRLAFRPRHNPFNTESMDLDHEEIDSQLANGTSEPGTNKTAVRAERLTSLRSHEAVKIETNTETSDTSEETVHHQKPIPKKRTKLYKLQSIVSDSTCSTSSQSVSVSSDNRSSMSTQSVSTNSSTVFPESTPSVSTSSDIRSPPPRGILKHNSSCSSSSSNIKSQLTQPVKQHGSVLATKDRSEESFLSPTDQEPLRSSSSLRSGLPESQLPAQLTLSNPVQTTQEKPQSSLWLNLHGTMSHDEYKSTTMQETSNETAKEPLTFPRTNVRSAHGTLSDEDCKSTLATHTANPKYKTNNSFNWSASAEPAIQQTSNDTAMEAFRSAQEAHLDKDLQEADVLQASLPKPEKVDKKMSIKESEKAQVEEDHSQDTVDQHNYGAISRADPTDASYRTSTPADISLDSNSGFEKYKHPLMVQPQSPKAIEEQGASIAKVLEWFSRSSDSSDKLDPEDSVQDMDDDITLEDIDIECEADLRPKRVDKVYLIVPRQSDEYTPKMNELEESWGKEQNLEKQEPIRETQGIREQGCDHEPVSMQFSDSHPKNASHGKMGISDKPGQAEKEVEIITNKEDSSTLMLDSTEGKLIGHQLKENVEDQTPNITNLLSFWEKSNTGPTTLIRRSGISNDQNNKPLKYSNVDRDTMNYGEEKIKSEITTEVKSSVAETKKQASMKEVINMDETHNATQGYLNKQGAILKDNKGGTQPLWSYANQKEDAMVSTSFADTNVISYLRKTHSASPDSESVSGTQSSECVTRSNKCSEGEHRSPATLNLDRRTKSEEKGLEVEFSSPTSSVALAKPANQEQVDRAEKIQRIKSFWEKEKWKHRKNVRSAAVDDSKSAGSSSTKVNKRFSKSAFDLRHAGIELDDELDDSMPTTNFVVLPLRDRAEKSVTEESVNSSQFKTLREFWAGSSEQSSAFESNMERPLRPKEKHAKTDTHKEISENSTVDSKLYTYQNRYPNQSDKISLKGFGNENGNTKPVKTEGNTQALKEKTVPIGLEAGTKPYFIDKPSGEAGLLKLSHFPPFPQTCTDDTGPPTLPAMLNEESQTRMSRKGMINGNGSSFQSATTTFEVNPDKDDQGQDLHLQSRNVPDTNLPPLRKTTEASTSPSRKIPESSLQLKKALERTRGKEKTRERRCSHTSEDTNSQALTRSLEDMSYSEGSESGGMHVPHQVTNQTSDLVCTPFQKSPEAGCELSGSTTEACTPLCFVEPCARRGSLELCPNVHADDALDPEIWNDADAWTPEHSHCGKESLVQGALRRAAARPVYHKSLENLTSGSKRPRKSSHADDSQPDSCDNDFSPSDSSTPLPPSSSFLDPEHLRKLSKSVPSFLQTNDDEDSDGSSHGSTLWRKDRPLGSSLGVASVSSVSGSGSVMSVYSSDFTGVEVQGIIRFAISYVESLRELHIFIVECQDLAIADPKRKRSDPYVKSYLVPDSANLGKRKTSVKKRTVNPIYKEILRYRVRMEQLRTQVLNLSVWHNDAFGRNCFLGETEVDLSTWDFGNTKIYSLFLKTRIPSVLQSADNRGEMTLSMRFLPQVSRVRAVPNSGEVHIWLKDCKNLPLVKGATANPYVKCVVLPDTSKKGWQKTRVLKKTANPVFNHTMVYDGFCEEDLKETCVEITVWDRERLTNRLIGGLRLSLGKGQSYGVNVDWMDSTTEEVALWERMMKSANEWVEDVLPLRMITAAKMTRK